MSLVGEWDGVEGGGDNGCGDNGCGVSSLFLLKLKLLFSWLVTFLTVKGWLFVFVLLMLNPLINKNNIK